MRKLTKSEAVELLETVFEIDGLGSLVNGVTFECHLIDTDPTTVLSQVADFCEAQGIDLDPDSVSARTDRIDEWSVDLCLLSISTGVVS